MKNVVAYCRVSTEGQAKDDKNGLEAQMESIREYCRKNDLNLLNSENPYVDVVSAVKGLTEGDRPMLDEIMYGSVKNPPVEAVIVAKSDRIARDIKLYFWIQGNLLKKNIQLISVVEDFGEWGAFQNILQAFVMFAAEQERTNIMKRTKGGRSVKATKGGYAGGNAPMGYKVENKALVVVEAEAAVVRRIFELRHNGVTMQGIIETLKSEGCKTRSGKDFVISTIQSILNNENTYRGLYKYGPSGAWVKGQHEAILKGDN